MAILPFEQRLAAAWPPQAWDGLTVLVAVSGGPDSVALLRGLHRLKAASPSPGRLVVAHFNHRLRPESDDDAAFVAALAAKLGLACESSAADPARLDLGDGLESAARDARYQFLQATAERLGARYVATGHTADDQVETILHHILRGTGLAGLAGMPRTRLLSPAVTLVRPLLAVHRAEIEEYLRQLGQDHRQDATNLSMQHTRNRIRHELLPLLEERFNAQVRDALLRLGALAGEAQDVLTRLADELVERAVTSRTGEEVCLDCHRLEGQPRYLVREAFCQIWRQQGWPLQDMTFRHWDELAEIATASQPNGSGSRSSPGPVVARWAGAELRLRHERSE